MLAMLTADDVRAALEQHKTVDRVAKALNVTRAWLYKRPDLRAVLLEYKAARPKRGPQRKLGEHRIVIPDDALERLDARCAVRAAEVGPRRASRSAVARELVEAASLQPLPPPLPPSGYAKIPLDLGPAWTALAAHLGTDDPSAVADVVRAILAQQEID